MEAKDAASFAEIFIDWALKATIVISGVSVAFDLLEVKKVLEVFRNFGCMFGFFRESSRRSDHVDKHPWISAEARGVNEDKVGVVDEKAEFVKKHILGNFAKKTTISVYKQVLDSLTDKCYSLSDEKFFLTFDNPYSDNEDDLGVQHLVYRGGCWSLFSGGFSISSDDAYLMGGDGSFTGYVLHLPSNMSLGNWQKIVSLCSDDFIYGTWNNLSGGSDDEDDVDALSMTSYIMNGWKELKIKAVERNREILFFLCFVFLSVLCYLYYDLVKKFFSRKFFGSPLVEESKKDVPSDVFRDLDYFKSNFSVIDELSLEHNKKGRRATKGVHMKKAREERDDFYEEIERLKAKRYALNDIVGDLEDDVRRTSNPALQGKILDDLERAYRDLAKIKKAFGEFYDKWEPSTGAKQKYASKVSSESLDSQGEKELVYCVKLISRVETLLDMAKNFKQADSTDGTRFEPSQEDDSSESESESLEIPKGKERETTTTSVRNSKAVLRKRKRVLRKNKAKTLQLITEAKSEFPIIPHVSAKHSLPLFRTKESSLTYDVSHKDFLCYLSRVSSGSKRYFVTKKHALDMSDEVWCDGVEIKKWDWEYNLDDCFISDGVHAFSGLKAANIGVPGNHVFPVLIRSYDGVTQGMCTVTDNMLAYNCTTKPGFCGLLVYDSVTQLAIGCHNFGDASRELNYGTILTNFLPQGNE